MGSTNLDAIETAQRVLLALAGSRDPDPGDIEKLRRLAPPLAHMSPDDLAAGVMQLARTISTAKIPTGNHASTDVAAGELRRCGLKRIARSKGSNQLNRMAASAGSKHWRGRMALAVSTLVTDSVFSRRSVVARAGGFPGASGIARG